MKRVFVNEAFLFFKFLQITECWKDYNRTSDAEENENRKVEDNQENSKHTQNREMIDTKKGGLPNIWKIVPLFVDKISLAELSSAV